MVIRADPKVLPGGWDSTRLPACHCPPTLLCTEKTGPGSKAAQIFTAGEGVQGPSSGFRATGNVVQ